MHLLAGGPNAYVKRPPSRVGDTTQRNVHRHSSGIMNAQRPGAMGNFPQHVPGAWGAGAESLPHGSASLTSGISPDAQYNQRVLEAAALLGPPPRLAETDPRARFPREIMLLPELWSGPDGTMVSNPYLTESVLFFEDEQMIEIIRRMAPPVVFLGNPTIRMKALYFNRAKVDMYTHTGVPRLVSRTFDQWDAAIPRVGLGGEFDEEMLGTKAGSQIIRDTIKQIQIAILDHCGVDCIMALLHARVQPMHFYGAHELPLPAALVYDHMQPELNHWGATTKNEFGIAKLCTFAKNQIKQQQGAEPDTVIMPPDVADYMRFSRPELTNYDRQGSKGTDRQERGGSAVLSPQLGGLSLLAAPLNPGLDQSPPQDLLLHLRMIGEMWLMDPDWHNHVPKVQVRPVHVPAPIALADDRGNQAEVNARQAQIDEANAANAAMEQQLEREKAARTIYIHNADSDTMRPIHLQDVRNYFQSADWRARSDAAAAALEQVGLDGAARLPAHLQGCPQAISDFCNEDGDHMAAWRDFAVWLVKPSQLFATSVFIFAKSGGDTAKTHVGYGDARWGRDATRKKAIIHYTTYAGCVVQKPQNVWIANSARIEKYLMGGGNTLGRDIFPILVPTEAASARYNYAADDLAKVRDRPVLGITTDAFTEVVSTDDENEFRISTIQYWQAAYGFRRNVEGGMLANNYKQHQEFNARVFQGHCEYAEVNENGLITRPRGNHILGKGHKGPWTYDGFMAALTGKGPTPYVQDPYNMRVR